MRQRHSEESGRYDATAKGKNPNVDESFRRFRVFEFEMRSRRSLAALLEEGPSNVRGSNRLFWQFDVLRYTMQFGITA